MLIMIIVLLILIGALAICAAVVGKAVSKPQSIRACCSVAQSLIVLSAVSFIFESLRLSYSAYNARYNSVYTAEGYNLDHLRVAELIILAAFFISAAAAVFFAHFHFKGKKGIFGSALLPLITVISVYAIASAVILVFVSRSKQADLFYEPIAVGTAASLLSIIIVAVNQLLRFNVGWQRVIITITNAINFIVIVGALVVMLIWGNEELNGGAMDITAVIIATVMIIIFAIPSILCVGATAADFFNLSSSDSGKKGAGRSR